MMTYKGLDDKKLIKLVINENDQSAFKVFFNRYYARLVRFSIGFVKTYENAEDVVEEVMLKFLKMQKKVLSIVNVKAYLFRMTSNMCQDHLARTKNNLVYESMEHAADYQYSPEPSPLEAVERDEFEILVNNTIKAFPPKRKSIFRLSREEGFSYKEIAELLNISEKTVESHMLIALKTLRNMISEYEEGLDTKTRKFNIK